MVRAAKLRRWLLRTAALELVILITLSGVAYAKYIQSQQLTGSVTITARMAQSVEVLEHKAQKNADGSYSLGEETVNGNTYECVLPGLDIPKNPFVSIQSKSPIDAYLFVEVVNGLGSSGITYELTAQWTKLDFPGEHGGDVYVYNGVIDETFGTDGTGTVQILANNRVTVSQNLDQTAKNLALTFYAALGEVAAGGTYQEIYNSIFTTP